MSAVLPIRILVVEDFRAFRQFLSTSLHARPEWQVIYEATDGLEAVQKAAELRPDLILLDIGLPKMDGIEVARRIGAAASQCKILFLSQQSSADVVREALNVGGHGYVLKSQAQTDLLTAIETVIRGQQFVSRGLRPE